MNVRKILSEAKSLNFWLSFGAVSVCIFAVYPLIFKVLYLVMYFLGALTLGLLFAILITIKVIEKAIVKYVLPGGAANRNQPRIFDGAAETNWFMRYLYKLLQAYDRVQQTIARRVRFYYSPKDSDYGCEKVELKDMQNDIMHLGQSPEPDVQSGTYVCVSQNVDLLMNRIFEYTYRDYVETWYARVSNDRGLFHKLVKSDFWETYDSFARRLGKVDIINLTMNRYTKILLQYFKDLDATDPVKKNYSPFQLHPCLKDVNTEKLFLRRISEYVIRLCFPNHISSHPSSRIILREILTELVFLPLIDTICDPDYINLSILAFISQREAAMEEKSRTYTYAATYEEFIRIISSTDDIIELQRIHRHIMTELLHATAISSLKRSDKKIGKPKSVAKGELLLSRDLKRYINQCQVAKQQCEKRLRALGGDQIPEITGDKGDAAIASSVRLLSYEEVLASDMARSYFLKYLKKIGKGPLLKFWCEVDILKESAPTGKNLAKIISHIYQTYIIPGSPDELDIEIDKVLLKGMQVCVLGNKNSEDFHTVQQQVSRILEKEHFPSFIVSDFYIRQLMPQLNDDGSTLAEIYHEEVNDQDHEHAAAFGGRQSSSDPALANLKDIEEKLEYKAQALESLRPAAKQDHKLTRVLEEEIADLQKQKVEQQVHIERTENWWSRMGSWSATIQSVSLPKEEEARSKYPVYSIVVVCSSLPLYEATDDVSGWVVARNLADFQQLHQQLRKFHPSLKKWRLPSLPVFSFGGLSEKFLETSKNSLNEYLKDIMNDQVLSRSELLYGFLSPAVDSSKKDDVKRKKFPRKTGLAKSSLGNIQDTDGQKLSLWQIGGLLLTLPKDILDSILRSEGGLSDSEEDDNEESLVDPDSIAAPMYELIREVFEIHGLFRALRKTLIIFVRLAFGSSINKQIRETVQWLVSEPMLTFYLQIFIDSMWPDGQLKPKTKHRTDEEKTLVALEAQVKLLQNIPEALQNLIGQENARRGFSKIFNALQDKQLNKHLFYNLLEETVEEVFPEILKPG